MALRGTWLVAFALLISGCESVVTPPAVPSAVAPIGEAVQAALTASAQADAARKDRDSKLTASLEVIGRQNEQAPQSAQQTVIAAEQAFSLSLLGNIQPTSEDRAAAAERELLLVNGRVQEARALYAEAAQKADALNVALARAESERDAALHRATQAVAEAARKLQEQQAKHERDMQALEARHARELAEKDAQVLRDQVRHLNYAAAACTALSLAVAGLAVGFGGVAAIRKAVPFAAFLFVAGLMCFGLAQIVGQWWFKWAVLSVAAGAFTWLGVWAYRHYKQGDLKAEAERRAAKLTTALHEVVPTLDNAYDNASADIRDLLDRTVFSRLSDAMSSTSKAAIHEVRAASAQ